VNTATFLTQVLSSPGYHIPVEANFVISIDGINELIKKLKTVEEEIADKNLLVDTNFNDILDQNDVFFATYASIPGESVAPARVGFASVNSVYGGLLSGPILKGRRDLAELKIGFIETNRSIVDYILRPWAVAISQYGLFARSSDSSQNFKTNITISYLDKTAGDINNSPRIRKRITFNNAAPTDIAGFRSEYGSRSETRITDTSWTYSTYKVST
jgi:hypothetical protein